MFWEKHLDHTGLARKHRDIRILEIKNSLPYIIFPNAQNRPLPPRVHPSQRRIQADRELIKAETPGLDVSTGEHSSARFSCGISSNSVRLCDCCLGFCFFFRCRVSLLKCALPPASLPSSSLHTYEASLLQASITCVHISSSAQPMNLSNALLGVWRGSGEGGGGSQRWGASKKKKKRN